MPQQAFKSPIFYLNEKKEVLGKNTVLMEDNSQEREGIKYNKGEKIKEKGRKEN